MRWKLGLVCGLCVSAAFAQTGGGGLPTLDEAEVNRLAELAPAERRAALKAMDPAERRGLWYAVMARVRANRGIEAPARGAYRAATPAGVAEAKSAAAPKAALGGAQIGQIQYDSGPFTQTFGGGAIVGNRFNTAAGRDLQNGMVTAVQGVVVPGAAVTTSSAGFVLLGPQTGGGGAMALFSSFTAAAGATDTVDFTGFSENFSDSYYVLFGDFSNSYVPAFGTGTTLGQGRHGVVGYTGGMGPNITGTFNFGGALNGFVRASGTILPVELLPRPE